MPCPTCNKRFPKRMQLWDFYVQIHFADEYAITKTAVNLLDLPDDPCRENENSMNIQECIKEGIEKRLNCIIPTLSFGEAAAPMSRLNKTLCSSRADYMNYIYLYDISYICTRIVFIIFHILIKLNCVNHTALLISLPLTYWHKRIDHGQ